MSTTVPEKCDFQSPELLSIHRKMVKLMLKAEESGNEDFVNAMKDCMAMIVKLSKTHDLLAHALQDTEGKVTDLLDTLKCFKGFTLYRNERFEDLEDLRDNG